MNRRDFFTKGTAVVGASVLSACRGNNLEAIETPVIEAPKFIPPELPDCTPTILSDILIQPIGLKGNSSRETLYDKLGIDLRSPDLAMTFNHRTFNCEHDRGILGVVLTITTETGISFPVTVAAVQDERDAWASGNHLTYFVGKPRSELPPFSPYYIEYFRTPLKQDPDQSEYYSVTLPNGKEYRVYDTTGRKVAINFSDETRFIQQSWEDEGLVKYCKVVELPDRTEEEVEMTADEVKEMKLKVLEQRRLYKYIQQTLRDAMIDFAIQNQ